MKKLEILEPELDEQHSRDIYKMSYVPEELTNLINLVEIDISGIYSRHLPQNIGQLTNLTTLSIRHCKLVTLPDSIGKFTNLKKLTDSFLQLTNLDCINLKGCNGQNSC